MKISKQNNSTISQRRPIKYQEAMAAESSNPQGVKFIPLALVGFCAFLGLYMTQPMLPMLQRLFQVPAKTVSLTVGAPVLAVALAAPLMGLLADALGRKRVIVAALIGLGASTLLAGTAHDLPVLLFWRFLQGLFIPAVIATIMAYISEESSLADTGPAMAAYVTGTVIGGFCGRFITGLVATHWGWQAPFLVLGTLTLASTLTVWRTLPRARHFVRQSNGLASVKGLWTHLKNPQLLAIYLVGFNVLFGLVGSFTYVNFYLAAPPFRLGSSALGSMFFVYLIGAVITPPSGWLISRIGNRRTVSLALLLSSSGIVMTLFHQLWLVILGMAFCCTGIFVCQASSSSQVGKMASTGKSSAAGIYLSFYYAGGVAGSIIPGLFWEWGNWPACVALIVSLQIVTAGWAFLTWNDRIDSGKVRGQIYEYE